MTSSSPLAASGCTPTRLSSLPLSTTKDKMWFAFLRVSAVDVCACYLFAVDGRISQPCFVRVVSCIHMSRVSLGFFTFSFILR